MNLSPSIPQEHREPQTRRLDVRRTLRPVIRAIGLTRLARGVLLGFALGATVAAGILVVAHIWRFSSSLSVALLSLVAGVIAGAAWGIVRWPRAPEAARMADLYFGLDDRLTTALELRSSNAPVALAQSRDAALHIDGLSLGRSRGRWLRRREVGVTFAAALAFGASLALGPHGAPRHASTAAIAAANSQKAHRAAANRIQQLRSQLHLNLTPGQQQTSAMRKLDLALARLRHQLLKSATTRASLRAISATQQQLHQLARGLHPVNAKAVAQLNSSLAHYLGKRPGTSKNGANARSTLATAQALNRLAQSLAHLSPSQRSALAQALAKAANATSNNSLRSSLRQAASNLANGNPQAASAALQRAAQSLSHSAGSQAAQAQANATAAQLGALKNQLISPGASLPSGQLANLPGTSNAQTGAPGTSNRSGQTPGKGAAPGKGQGKGRGLQQGQGAGKGSGTRLGSRPGRGNGQGRGARSGQGTTGTTGTSGAHGSGGRGHSGVTHKGRTVTVYIPGTQGKGPEIVRNGPNGAPQPGAIVPYQQVYGQYAQGAHQALDRAALPPSVQVYVRRYFSTISH
ncbi:MAG TPA: hypothetical protein VF898_07455 [Chloroflexota bacterium]